MEKIETIKKTENINTNKEQWIVWEEYEKLKKDSGASLSTEGLPTENEIDDFCPLLPIEKYKKISAPTKYSLSGKLFIFEKETNAIAAVYRIKKENDALCETRKFFNIFNKSYNGFTNITIKYLLEENEQNNIATRKPINLIVTDAIDLERIIKYEDLTINENSILKSETSNTVNMITFEKIKREDTNNSAQESAKKDYENFQKNGKINLKTEEYLFEKSYKMEIWEKTDNSGKKQYKAFMKDGNNILSMIDYVTNENGVTNRFSEKIFNVFNTTNKKYENIKTERLMNEKNELDEISVIKTDPKTNEILSFYDSEKINEVKGSDPINKFILEGNKTIENIFKNIKNQ